MKAIAILLVMLVGASACKKSSTADCGMAIGKGVDQLRERRKAFAQMRSGDLTPTAKAQVDAQAKLMEAFSAQLKTTLTTRCIEDKWPAEVIDCYESTASPDEMRKCRIKLPAEAAERARLAEVNLMTSMTGAVEVVAPVTGSGAAGSGSAGSAAETVTPGSAGIVAPGSAAAGSATAK